MAIQTSYPGVYVQEVPSGVRTIAGVSTSVTLFIGRAASGPLDEPILCLNPTDFERVFSNDTSYGDLPRAIRLFFQNGGSQCYIMRIANGAVASTVNLRNENGNDVLGVKSKAVGIIGDTIRIGINYAGQQPESTFNLEVFRWETNLAGQQIKSDQEIWQGLSMDPSSLRYAPLYISQKSKLIELTDLNFGASASSISRAGRLTPFGSNVSQFAANWKGIIETGIGSLRLLKPWNGSSAILLGGSFSGSSSKKITFTVDGSGAADLSVGPDVIDISWNDGLNNGTIQLSSTYVVDDFLEFIDGLEISFGIGTLREGETFTLFVHPPAYRFRISVNGGRSWSDLSLLGHINFEGIAARNEIVLGIQTAIDRAFSAGTVIVSLEPPGTVDQQYLQFASGEGDIRIESATTNDLARILMLGSAQGGIEISRHAVRRPAPTGLVFNLNHWNDFAELGQNAFDLIFISGNKIELDKSLQSLEASTTSKMYQDGQISSPSGGYDGIREKFGIIANAINTFRLSNPDFAFKAYVAGQRLFLEAQAGGDNTQGSVETGIDGGGGFDINPFFIPNVRYYSIGNNGLGNYQTPGTSGKDGYAPTLDNFYKAFEIIEREVDLFNLMVLPKDVDHDLNTVKSLWGPASTFCQKQRAFLIMDSPENWTDSQSTINVSSGVNSLRIGLVKDHSAIFFPMVTIRENGLNVSVGPSGAIAGLMARIDSNRGVWKAPAGTEADLRGIVGLKSRFSDSENGIMNPRGINTLRIFPNGIVNWGARTMDGDDYFGSEWKYIPVRRTALYIEESLYRGLKWVVFEPNDEPLWSQIRLNVGAFMHNLFRQGAFQGIKKQDAYFVKCDSETTTQNDINMGRVNVWVGFAPLKPAEFVILYLQQMTGQIQI